MSAAQQIILESPNADPRSLITASDGRIMRVRKEELVNLVTKVQEAMGAISDPEDAEGVQLLDFMTTMEKLSDEFNDIQKELDRHYSTIPTAPATAAASSLDRLILMAVLNQALNRARANRSHGPHGPLCDCPEETPQPTQREPPRGGGGGSTSRRDQSGSKRRRY